MVSWISFAIKTKLIAEPTKGERMFGLIERWKESVNTQKKFSRENGITNSKFLYCIKKKERYLGINF